MVYGSTPYVGMTPKKMAATLKVHKWHAQNVCVRLVKGLHEPYQALLSASMSNWTINFAGEHLNVGVLNEAISAVQSHKTEKLLCGQDTKKLMQKQHMEGWKIEDYNKDNNWKGES